MPDFLLHFLYFCVYFCNQVMFMVFCGLRFGINVV